MNEKGISLVQLRQRKTRQTAALFLAPVIILLVVFIAYPIIDTFITSGYQWNGISADKKMVGLANWAKLIKDTKFWIAFKNNVIIMILSIIIQIPLGLAMATFLDFGGKILPYAITTTTSGCNASSSACTCCSSVTRNCCAGLPAHTDSWG